MAKRKNRRPEVLSRTLEFSSYRTAVRLHVGHRGGEEPSIESRPWLEVRGRSPEPLRDVTDVMVSLYPEDTPTVGPARPAACGAIIRVRPVVEIVLTWPHLDFDRIWAMALAGQLTHGRIAFTTPHYNTAAVLSASFSNEAEE